jgi:hypothetical protein
MEQRLSATEVRAQIIHELPEDLVQDVGVVFKRAVTFVRNNRRVPSPEEVSEVITGYIEDARAYAAEPPL